ncbi:MAG: UDP-N-acetylmuramoyl-tripeptide--D-alanyl-D-alanine ligase [Flavobacteriales bacterium]
MMELEALYQVFLDSNGVVIDTREDVAGKLFFAIRGERQDGNRFAEEALEKGAKASVVDNPTIKAEGCIHVENVLQSLQNLAAHHRHRLSIPVIAITGSNGKTTTKELTARVLRARYHAFATPGNLNNYIGLPLSVLSIKEEDEVALLEFGADHPGENELLARISDPTHGLVTNIGLDHLEGFGDREGVFRGNKELIDHLEARGGHAFFHADDPDIQRMKPEKLSSNSYGTDASCDLQGSLLNAEPCLELEWRWKGNEARRFKTSLIGSYNFPNILAALCIGSGFGVPASSMESTIAAYEPDNNRSQVVHTERNEVLLDAYNANPSSMEAALESFLAMEGGPKRFILGDMLEMGAYEEELHLRILHLLEDKGLTEGMLVGRAFQKAAADSGIPAYEDLKAAKKALKEAPYTESQILVKGSRGLRLEELLENL